MVDEFVEARQGRRECAYLLPELEEVLAETYGVILYQDQVLLIANKIAGYSLGEGDLLRKAMGKKIPAEMESQRAKFVDGAVRNGHPQEKANQLFDLIFEFSGYGFGKAHSVAYALLTHQTAYIKAHYPAEFYAAAMTAEWREQGKLDRYVKDAAKRSIAILQPSVNESESAFGVSESGQDVRFGLGAVKNVGEGAVEAILEERGQNGSFENLFDFCSRVETRKVNRRVVESLIRCGAFDFTKATRASLWRALPGALERGQRAQRDRELGQEWLFGDVERAAEQELDEIEEWTRSQLLSGEKEMLGFYLTGHPLSDRLPILERFATYRLDSLPEAGAKRSVWLGGLVSGLRTQKTRRGDLMARAQLEDLSGTINTVFFPESYEKSAALLREDVPVFLKGSLNGEGELAELQVEDAIPLEDAWHRCTTRLVLRVASDAVTPERLQALRAILDLVPGPVPVHLEVTLPGGAEAVLDLRRHRVAVSSELVGRIDTLFAKPVAHCCLE
jgi:DNA polymerase-3 subunit alpha